MLNIFELLPGDLIEVEYKTRLRDNADGQRWVRASILYCEPGTWPLARLADEQLTELRPFMRWRLVAQAERIAQYELAS